ncbi:hypothetical protein [Niallia sp. 03091]|uniref:hypothetical protein n=1 Tax=Niallia sp. 03091 TaxID=3458059 RepID=UPI0040448F95
MDWKSVVISMFTSSIVTLIINSMIRGGISHFYNKKLENFKSELSLLTEEKKLDFQRKIHDFSLYSTKRHEIYPILYKKISDSFNDISLLNKWEQLSVNLRQRQENSNLENQLPNTIEKIKETLQKTEECLDYFIDNDLYISKELSHSLSDLIGRLAGVSNYMHIKKLLENNNNIELSRDIIGTRYDQNDLDVNSEIEKLNDEIYKVKEQMKLELGVGDYK